MLCERCGLPSTSRGAIVKCARDVEGWRNRAQRAVKMDYNMTNMSTSGCKHGEWRQVHGWQSWSRLGKQLGPCLTTIAMGRHKPECCIAPA